MKVIKLAQQACYTADADSLMTYVKIQTSKTDVSIDDKMERYEQ